MTAPFPVSPKKQLDLQRMMQRLGVQESDLEERFIRSRGPGGQNVNKVATCVVVRHRPSGLEVRCQQERSQALNRFLARRLLLGRLEAERLGRLSAEAQRIAKLRRQKRKRSKRAKEKLLRDKHLHAEKKLLRKLPRSSDEYNG
jgi:protein subunit release factor B